MKYTRFIAAAFAALMALNVAAEAAEGAKAWQVHNRFRVEYDDNIYQTEENTTDSLKLIDNIDLLGSVNTDQTYFGAAYRPAFIYWFDRDDDTDLHHELVLDLAHKFTPQLSLTAKERFLYQDQPELIDGATPIRADSTYIYNDLSGGLNYRFTPATDLDLSARYDLIRYDEDLLAVIEDFDLWAVGASVNHQLVPETSLSGDLRYESIRYDTDSIRDADSIFVGLGAAQTFSPTLLASLRGGYQQKDFDDSAIDKADAPYVDVAVTWLPGAATRLTGGGGYFMDNSNVGAFANQERTRLYAALAHDFTAKITWDLSANMSNGAYDANESVTRGEGLPPVVDGDEDIVLVSTSLSYAINTTNWLQLGYNYTDVSSDVRRSYDRNRVSLGWKVQI